MSTTPPAPPAPPSPPAPAQRRPLVGSRRPDAMTALSAGTLLAAAAVLVAFFVLVRGEPRPDLAASSGAAVVAAAVAVLLRVPAAPLAGVGIGGFLVLFPALRAYYAFSLERPDETVGLAFTVSALAVAGLLLVSGTAATVAALGRARPLRTPAAALAAMLGGLAAGLVAGLAVSTEAQPDQAAGLSDAEVAALPEVVMDDYRFSPDRLEVTAGEELALRLRNDDTETYRFVVDELGVDVVVPSGRTAVLRLTPGEPGTVDFYSSEEGGEHRELGMTGTLTVLPG